MNSDKILQALKSIARDSQLNNAVLATVTTYNPATNTITAEPIDGTAAMTGVRLQPDAAGVGVLLVPQIGSVVLILKLNRNEGEVIMTSATDSIQLLDGSFGGLVQVTDLVTKLNNIENDLNDLKAALNGWTPIPNDGGAALKSALTSYIAAQLTPTTTLELENDKITHGLP